MEAIKTVNREDNSNLKCHTLNTLQLILYQLLTLTLYHIDNILEDYELVLDKAYGLNIEHGIEL